MEERGKRSTEYNVSLQLANAWGPKVLWENKVGQYINEEVWGWSMSSWKVMAAGTVYWFVVREKHYFLDEKYGL
jgi:hypothetical protein